MIDRIIWNKTICIKVIWRLITERGWYAIKPNHPTQERTYTMDSNTDHVVASLNLEEIIKNFNTWNHLDTYM